MHFYNFQDLIASARKAKLVSNPLSGVDGPDPVSEETQEGNTDDAAASESTESKIAGGEPEAVFLAPETTPDIANLPFEFNSYCPWTIVNRNGLLLPGNPQSCGAIRYKNSFYTFVNRKALEDFRYHPKEYLEDVAKAAQKQPELINLLGMQDQFPDLQLGNQTSRPPVHPLLAAPQPKTRDQSTETPVHFVTKNIDYNYNWNTWDIRRKAVQYANLRKAKTTSMQTNSSHFRAAAATQVWLPKEKGTMTGINKGTNPIRDHNYLTGLRGGAVHDFEKPNGVGRGGLLTKYGQQYGQQASRKSRSAETRDSVFKKSGASILNMRLEL